MPEYLAPGVYVEETTLKKEVAQVETSIPAFIGFTEKKRNAFLRIHSFEEYRKVFGRPFFELPDFETDGESVSVAKNETIPSSPSYKMYYVVKHFFANGGTSCFISSAGLYKDKLTYGRLFKALERLERESFADLIVLADVHSLESESDQFKLKKAALTVASRSANCLYICDINHSATDIDDARKKIRDFRSGIGNENLKYGAAYFPNLTTTLIHEFDEQDVRVNYQRGKLVLRHSERTIKRFPEKEDESLYHREKGKFRKTYHKILKMIKTVNLELPPSGAVAGVFKGTDSATGVWKAPANVSLHQVIKPAVNITDALQQEMNIHQSGKSINAIRMFDGKNTLIWGARTLAGNDNEWRYISVRRLAGMIRQSIEQAAGWTAFEMNDATLWSGMKSQITGFLEKLWREGAFQGSKPQEAFFVKAGLGLTMTEADVSEGRVLVEIGLAALRPSEFIILQIELKAKT